MVYRFASLYVGTKFRSLDDKKKDWVQDRVGFEQYIMIQLPVLPFVLSNIHQKSIIILVKA